jgi:PAS domain S-box-containing protein
MEYLLESPHFWSVLCENLNGHAVVLLDKNGAVTAWNEAACVMEGYEAKEIIGEHFSRFYTPEDKAMGQPERELVAAAALGRYEEDGWRVRKDGTRFWAHVVITPIREEGGAVRGFGKIVRDVTARKQAAQQSANAMTLKAFRSGAEYSDLVGYN